MSPNRQKVLLGFGAMEVLDVLKVRAGMFAEGSRVQYRPGVDALSQG